MGNLTKEDKLVAIEEAQIKMGEIIDLLEPIAEGDSNFRVYWLEHFKILMSEDHGFLTRDLNLDKMKERIEEEDAPSSKE